MYVITCRLQNIYNFVHDYKIYTTLCNFVHVTKIIVLTDLGKDIYIKNKLCCLDLNFNYDSSRVPYTEMKDNL